MMLVRVHFFGATRDASGVLLQEVGLPVGATIADLRDKLIQAHPTLQRILPYTRWAVNETYVDETFVLPEHADIALIPPVAGGANATRVELVADVIEVATLEQWARADDLGAVTTFVGVVRNHHDGKAVRSLRYEAYQPMAIKMMLNHCQQSQARFGVARVGVIHRLGTIPIGQAAVAVVVSAAHRQPTFEAVAWIMDQIKADVPIFKHETYVDGRTQWVGLPQT